MAKANILCPIVNRSLAVGFELEYSDSRKILAGSEVDSFAVANVTLSSREFAKGFRVSASAYNVFNTRYSDVVGNEIVGSTVQQNGRDFRVQLTRSFHFR